MGTGDFGPLADNDPTNDGADNDGDGVPDDDDVNGNAIVSGSVVVNDCHSGVAN